MQTADGTDFLSNDLAECQRLLLAAFKLATRLERRVVDSEQQVAQAWWRAAACRVFPLSVALATPPPQTGEKTGLPSCRMLLISAAMC